MQPCNDRVAQFRPLVNRNFRLYVGNLARRARSPAAADSQPCASPGPEGGGREGAGRIPGRAAHHPKNGHPKRRGAARTMRRRSRRPRSGGRTTGAGERSPERRSTSADDRRTGKAATATDRRGPRPQTRGEPPAPGGAKPRKGKASDKGSAAGHGPTTRGGPGPAGAQRGRAAARSGPSANTAATTTEPRHLHHRRAISARDEAPPDGEAQRGGPQAAEAP